jgi:uncharacterized protein YqeY
MALFERIQMDMTAAMRARDEARLGSIRRIKAALQMQQIDAMKPLDEAAELKILNTLIRQRREAADMFRKGGRAELADKEEAELKLIESYMPAASSDEEVDAVIRGGYLTYTIRDFVMESPPQFMITPDIQTRAQFPFTMDCAQRFFGHFMNHKFTFAGMITSIVIYDGKENLPNHSYAAGLLFRETLEEMALLGKLSDHIGTIHFEYGGTTTNPTIRVEVASKSQRTK